jgi:hypothetical protein
MCLYYNTKYTLLKVLNYVIVCEVFATIFFFKNFSNKKNINLKIIEQELIMLTSFDVFRIPEYIKKSIEIYKESGLPYSYDLSLAKSYKLDNVYTLTFVVEDIAKHYGLSCKFSLSLEDISARASISIPTNIPDPRSDEFKTFIFKIKVNPYILNNSVEHIVRTLAHEVAHAYLYSHKIEMADHEKFNDTFVIFSGFSNLYFDADFLSRAKDWKKFLKEWWKYETSANSEKNINYLSEYEIFAIYWIYRLYCVFDVGLRLHKKVKPFLETKNKEQSL